MLARSRTSATFISMVLVGIGMTPFACVSQNGATLGVDGGLDSSLAAPDGGAAGATGIPTGIDFGLSDCGGAAAVDKTFTVTNTGGTELRISAQLRDARAFSLSSTSATIAPGGAASFTLHALPVPASAAAGAPIADALFVTTNVASLASLQIPVTITPHGATLALNPVSASFGAVAAGATATPIPITVQNTGNGDAQIAFGTPTSAQFSVTGSPLSVAAGASGQVSIGFTASSNLPVQGSVPITVTGAVCGAPPSSLPVSGLTAFPSASVPTTTIDFGFASCGGAAPATQPLVVSNVGSAALHVTSASFGASKSFTVASPTGSFPLTVDAGSTQTLTLSSSAIAGNATAGAATTAVLTLATDDAAHAQIQVPVKVTAQGATLVMTTSTAFPGTVPGTQVTRPLTLTNTGNQSALVTIGQVTDLTDFSLTYTGAPSAVTLAPNASVPSLVAGFDPQSDGPLSATASLGVNVAVCTAGADSALTAIALSGTGQGFGFLPDAGPDGCIALVCAVIGANACGVVDTCGTTIDCGKCAAGSACDPATHTCQPTQTACTKAGAACGTIVDECGAPIYCGGCGQDQVCDGATHACVTCKPLSKTDCTAQNLCGIVPDGCLPSTATIDCGACAGSCNEITHKCNCSPQSCPPGVCGTFDDGCGGRLDCTDCGAAPECAGKCGMVENACGSQSLQCPGCADNQRCMANNTCCTFKTCGPNQCGLLDDGCGGFVQCPGCEKGTCGGGGVPNQCGNPVCVPKSCGPNDCGAAIDDGCGGTIDCSKNACGGGTTCGALGTCCTAATQCPSNQCAGNFADPCTEQLLPCSNACTGAQVCNPDSQFCCAPKTTCAPGDCGAAVPDGCGGTIDCSQSSCGAGTCFNGTCCTPSSAKCPPTNMCGSIDPGCGLATIFCDGECGANQPCINNQCCVPTCAPNACGTSEPDGCGGFIDCSAQGNACGAGQSCQSNNGGFNGTCCTPTVTCNGGSNLSCQPQDDGCGNPITCFACPVGSLCEPDGTCCTPATCQGNQNGLFPDGCGGTLSCTPS